MQAQLREKSVLFCSPPLYAFPLLCLLLTSAHWHRRKRFTLLPGQSPPVLATRPSTRVRCPRCPLSARPLTLTGDLSRPHVDYAALHCARSHVGPTTLTVLRCPPCAFDPLWRAPLLPSGRKPYLPELFSSIWIPLWLILELFTVTFRVILERYFLRTLFTSSAHSTSL